MIKMYFQYVEKKVWKSCYKQYLEFKSINV